MRSSITGVVVVALLAAACGDKDQAPPPKTPETTAVATTPPPPPPPSDTTPPPPPPAPKPSLAELQQKAGQTIIDGFNAHDSAKSSSVYADNAIVRIAGMPMDITGKDNIKQGQQRLFDTWSNFKAATQYAFVNKDVVIAVWQMTGTHSGEFLGVKPTEKPVGWTGASVIWFNDDGQVKEEHVYYDVPTIMAQIGAMKGAKARAIPALAAQPTMITAKGDDTESKNVDTVKNWFSTGFDAKTPDVFLGTMSDDVEWDDAMNPMGSSKGKAPAKKYFEDTKKAFPDAKVQISNAWGAGDFVIVEDVFTGTNNGAFMGKPATKKQVNMHGLDVVQMKDGKAVKGWSFGNGGEMAMQLGWIKPPTAAGEKGAAPAAPAKPATPAKGGSSAPKK
jgi:steroid delta-isomerase-like uncharacterized protein